MVIQNCIKLLEELSSIEAKIAVLEDVGRLTGEDLDQESLLRSIYNHMSYKNDNF